MQYGISERLLARILIAFSLSIFIPISFVEATATSPVNSPYYFTFNSAGILNEAGSMNDSWSGYWWVNSGGKMIVQDGIGSTVHGALTNDYWKTKYASANPLDTDGGAHPQNLFRLVSRSMWENAHVESLFMVDADNFSASPNRNSSNGLLLMLRYKSDGQTLYYAGLRVDGTAILKKKINGAYYTMAQKQIFPGTYVAGGTTNLLPHGTWLTIGAESVTNTNGSVTVRLLVRKPGESTLSKVLEVTDSGQFGASAPIADAGYIGIRTDFMDVSFDTFKAIKI